MRYVFFTFLDDIAYFLSFYSENIFILFYYLSVSLQKKNFYVLTCTCTYLKIVYSCVHQLFSEGEHLRPELSVQALRLLSTEIAST